MTRERTRVLALTRSSGRRLLHQALKPEQPGRIGREHLADVRLGVAEVEAHCDPEPEALERADVSSLVTRMMKTPVTANRVLSCLRKMFNMAEVWGLRNDSTK